MTTEKFVALLEKLLQKTKDGKIKWKRYTVDPEFESWASDKKSFSCTAGTMKIDMLSDDDSDNICFFISYDPNLPEVSYSPQTDEELRISLRLVNYVYNQFPNLEKAIDAFLNED